jgi:hypothetical protein
MEKPVNDKASHIIFWLGSACIVILIIYLRIAKDINHNKVVEGFESTEGWITKYLDKDYSDLSSGRTIRYSYEVNGKVYSRTVDTQEKLADCGNLEMKKGCTDKRFWVMYSKKDPSISLIKFSLEIQDIKNPEWPKNADGFQ